MLRGGTSGAATEDWIRLKFPRGSNGNIWQKLSGAAGGNLVMLPAEIWWCFRNGDVTTVIAVT